MSLTQSAAAVHALLCCAHQNIAAEIFRGLVWFLSLADGFPHHGFPDGAFRWRQFRRQARQFGDGLWMPLGRSVA
jgi:hypothetical protein